MNKHEIEIRKDVADALRTGAPIVALESTIIAHGMPYPQNMETALAVEEIVRQAGAIPATIAIREGKMKVGLTRDEIEWIATDNTVLKASDRDIPFILARKLSAATTVSASLAIASAVGINVFVTGGIGGVGPNGFQTLDISSDLVALADYHCITVCAGAKAFMDIPATLEYLETNRVGVIGYQTQNFPLFYTRGSQYKLDWSAETPEEVADIYKAKMLHEHKGGLLVGVALADEDALSYEETRWAIDVALADIKTKGIVGKEVTPFILASIKKETDGKSLTANIALIKSNASVGGKIAVALAQKLTVRRSI
ncbi:MAG: pseudouridine-5'-phosphate glycosidase [Anaerolineaceae bacterium]|jgi:pseudouridine-5'-phosphate glycosidase|nr:pseudouridine-5'-phosphate glycosidase [Anaerolineaceae bacterium]